MLSGFVDAGGDEPEGAGGYKYFRSPDSGRRKTKGWFKALPDSEIDVDEYEADEYHWFYAKANGYLACNELLKIETRTYLFNDRGERVDGLVAVMMVGDNVIIGNPDIDTMAELEEYRDSETGEFDWLWGVYLFGKNGAMRTGKQTVKLDGESVRAEFDESGRLIWVE